MTPESPWIGGFCRLYSMLLYAYPPEFRREFGRPMQQTFRDRCREIAHRPGPLSLVRFAAHVISDWVRTSLRERAAVRSESPKRGALAEWAGTLLIYLFATTTLVQAYVIPTPSMDTSLMVGDHVLIDRVTFADPGPLGRHVLPYREIQRGDVIAFLYPEDVRQTYVKRVIGLPGDRIRLKHGQVIRNGRRLVEPYTQHIAMWRNPYADDFPQTPAAETTSRGRDMLEHHVYGGEVVVPPGTVFALGDNRDNSADSRYWGFVPRGNIVGKPVLVYWSFDAPTADLEEWSFDHVVDVALHFFTKTRWNRTFLVPRAQPAQEVEP